MDFNTIRNPFPDNVQDDGVSYSPQSWSERQNEIRAEVEKMRSDSQMKQFGNLVKSVLM